MAPTVLQQIIPGRWPGIVFTEQGETRLKEVSDFLDTLPEAHPDLAAEVRKAFTDKLDYLNGYGGAPDDPEKRYWVELSYDLSPYSFSVLWRTLGRKGPVHFNGGLIWHGGGNETYNVSLTPQWWGVHT